MLCFPIISVTVSCPADVHCFTGTDYDELILHLSQVVNESSEFYQCYSMY